MLNCAHHAKANLCDGPRNPDARRSSSAKFLGSATGLSVRNAVGTKPVHRRSRVLAQQTTLALCGKRLAKPADPIVHTRLIALTLGMFHTAVNHAGISTAYAISERLDAVSDTESSRVQVTQRNRQSASSSANRRHAACTTSNVVVMRTTDRRNRSPTKDVIVSTRSYFTQAVSNDLLGGNYKPLCIREHVKQCDLK